ncbi:MAG: EAL domain-containing protein [Sulfuricurvum sp.]|nr:EAL domain-containing protein [Sulfuricurvum sp.]
MKRIILPSAGLKTAVLLPLTIVLITLISLFVYGYSHQEKIYTQKYIDKELLVAKRAMDSGLIADADKLSAALTIITADPGLKRAMIAGDREALLEQSNRYFKTLREKNDITHFYFHLPNRVNFLRVHNSQRHSDKIDRYSLLQAQSTQKPSSATEIGPMGLFTLRVVFPWYENGTLIGYVEMGQEIEHLYTHIKEIANVDLHVIINKKVLSKGNFESGMKLMDRTAQWNDLPHSVVIFTTLPEQRHTLIKQISKCNPLEQGTMNVTVDDNIYHVSSLLLSDSNPVNDGTIGCIFFVHDVTALEQKNIYRLFLAIGVGAVFGGLLILFFYFLFYRVEIKLRKATERFYLHFEQNPLAVIEWDTNFKVLEWNPAAEKLFGYTKEEAIGNSAEKLILAEKDTGHVSEIWQALLSGNGGYRSTNENITKEKNTIICEWYNTPLMNEKGEIIGVASMVEDLTQQKRSEEKIAHLGYYDLLTELPNRLLFKDRLEDNCRKAHRYNYLVGILYINIDHLKNINDTLGHTIGDLVIKSVALRIKEAIRESDTLSRFGGDEFTILISELKDLHNLERIISTIFEMIKEPIQIHDQELFITLSIGSSIYPLDDISPENLIRNADTAMNLAKTMGRNQYQQYKKELTDQATKVLSLQNGLRNAIKNEEFVLYYQPQMNLKTGMIIGAEALVRWKHPEDGLRSPLEFIPIAEESGLIVPMGEWILRTACKQAKEWHEQGMSDFTIAVNLSARQFREDGFAKMVLKIIQESQVETSFIELELTESILAENTVVVLETLNIFKQEGIKISLDDFGTGYSSLSYLKLFPIDKLKIDQSFVRDALVDKSDASLVRTIIAMGKALELTTIAEGVETKEQMDFLRMEECDEIQGYFLAKPLPADEFIHFLRNRD